MREMSHTSFLLVITFSMTAVHDSGLRQGRVKLVVRQLYLRCGLWLKVILIGTGCVDGEVADQWRDTRRRIGFDIECIGGAEY